MNIVTITAPGVEQLATALQERAMALPSLLQPATSVLLEQSQQIIEDAYGVHLAAYWNYAPGIVTTAAASLQVSTTEDKVLWYEFGTRAHTIRALNKRALRYGSSTGTRFAAHVWHPGTPAHNMRGTVETRLIESATGIWSAAINQIMAGL
jgi:hypothetical protein